MSENMSDKWVDYAVRIQSIAQAGLAYCEDKSVSYTHLTLPTTPYV